MRHWILILACSAGCGSGQQQATRSRDIGAAQHEREAARNEREASEHEAVYESLRRREAVPPTLSCTDAPLWVADSTGAGERLPVLRPCWTVEQRPSRDQLWEAAEHRRQAAQHRAMAEALRTAERHACRELGEEEMSHSPFYHRDDVLRVEPVEREGRAQGVRVVFRRVVGLDGAWMRKAVSCHQARAAALGYPPTVMTYCPLMIAPTTATVEETAETVAVVIWADRDEQAAMILARARRLDRGTPRSPTVGPEGRDGRATADRAGALEPVSPAPARLRRRGVLDRQDLPAVVRQLLRHRMKRHADAMESLLWSSLGLQYELIVQRSRWVAAEPRIARPSDGGDEALVNQLLPAGFFELQEELHCQAIALGRAAERRDDEAIGQAYGRMAATCIRCHALYLRMPAAVR